MKKNKVPYHAVSGKLLVESFPRELWQLERENLGDWRKFFL